MMEEITLVIDGKVFKAKKDVLCEYSDYFRAMFSGSYVENNQKIIKIEVIDATSMTIILQYMEMGFIDLFEHSISTIGDLALAANFLQITELTKQIEFSLEVQLSVSNWVETMTIAENSSYTKLQQFSAAFGLFSFKSMKPEDITSIEKLYWYLSHPYLDADNELDVFNFGLQWISQTETGADALLIILCCLDVKRLTTSHLDEMKTLVKDYVNSLAAKVVDCLYELCSGNYELSALVIADQKSNLCEMFTERVYSEALNICRYSRHRRLCKTPTVPVWTVKDVSKPELTPHHMYTYTKFGFERWLEVAEKNLWGWNVTSWGLTKLVVVCGEHGRGSGVFMKDVKVYDTLRKEWTRHGVELPPRRHGGVAVIGDSLYIVGGLGSFRVVMDTAIIYDLKQRTFRKIAKIPEALQNPAVCAHKNVIYMAGQKHIYRYEDLGDSDYWVIVVATDLRMTCLASYGDYVYCTQHYFSHLYRFKPGVDRRLKIVCYFNQPAVALCSLGYRLIAFTRSVNSHSGNSLGIEEYSENENIPKVIWSHPGGMDSIMRVNDVAGSCSLVMDMPPLCPEVPEYHRRYLSRYSEYLSY